MVTNAIPPDLAEAIEHHQNAIPVRDLDVESLRVLICALVESINSRWDLMDIYVKVMAIKCRGRAKT